MCGLINHCLIKLEFSPFLWCSLCNKKIEEIQNFRCLIRIEIHKQLSTLKQLINASTDRPEVPNGLTFMTWNLSYHVLQKISAFVYFLKHLYTERLWNLLHQEVFPIIGIGFIFWICHLKVLILFLSKVAMCSDTY